ncbi:MAG: recombination regulator RecX [Neptuniibacter sp.]
MSEQLSEKELWNKAIQYLSRREYSRMELFAKLGKQSPEAVDSVLDSLEKEGYLSDRRFTESFIRMRAAQGHGLNRVRFDLKKKGVDTGLISEVLDELEMDWYELATDVYRRKYSQPLDKSDYKERSKRMRFMSQRGFSMDEIQYSLENSEQQDF